ncbi:hypothetical protein K1T71_007624 [Dendrolimus kikuchii]|uniref:Uncharacterized protein n=1 Tax=Dendrolimus kikuchii TaxID=765133 RepID=A0ACC1CXS7_9NEOP|nr:hypothetical protein K1T71_007624 [Dendrolimus kikuchii]
MAFAAARMILKDKRRKASKEDFRDPRNRSKFGTLGNCSLGHDEVYVVQAMAKWDCLSHRTVIFTIIPTCIHFWILENV